MNDWWVLNMMFIIMWCIFSFNWIVRIIWSCWMNMMMLLVFIYVMCIYVVGELFYMLLLLSCWCKHVMNKLMLIVEVVRTYALLLIDSYVHASWHVVVDKYFVFNYAGCCSGCYDVFVASKVTTLKLIGTTCM